MIKSIIFDFDGTIADTLPTIYESFGVIFRKHLGRNIEKEEVHSYFGPPETIMLKNIFKDKQNTDEIIREFFKVYEEIHKEKSKVNHEINAFLNRMKAKNIQMGILTGKGRVTLDISLRLLRMQEFFSATITGDEVIKPKPAPDGVFQVMKMIGAEKETTIYTGDSDVDIIAGKAAGLRTYGALWMPNTQNASFTEKADAVCCSIKEFETIIEKG